MFIDINVIYSTNTSTTTHTNKYDNVIIFCVSLNRFCVLFLKSIILYKLKNQFYVLSFGLQDLMMIFFCKSICNNIYFINTMLIMDISIVASYQIIICYFVFIVSYPL